MMKQGQTVNIKTRLLVDFLEKLVTHFSVGIWRGVRQLDTFENVPALSNITCLE